MPKDTITPNMTVLDVVSKFHETMPVFRNYDKLAGECICCESLFETLEDVAHIYGLDLKRLIDDLEASVEVG
ncbi:MAG: hypothetical protein SVS15_05595 [Thermodesulfobacteriota bacterium]|nr:hypothetical protein [Thermodesulfobacteriota bacterium]